MDPESLAKIREALGYYPGAGACRAGELPPAQDDDVLTIGGHAWRCIAGYGHAPEHMALYCEALQVLISGDMVLPRISTNVSVYDIEPEADPLTLFLASIDRFGRCRTRWCCPRMASPSAGCTRASASCTNTIATGWPK